MPLPEIDNDEPERIDIGTAIARAGYDGDDGVDLWQWHPCVDQPNCSDKRGQPCACAGIPYIISDEVWAELGPVIRAIRNEAWAAGRTAAAAEIATEIDGELTGDLVCAWTKGEAAAIARSYAEGTETDAG
jgi:hypothetical protein